MRWILYIWTVTAWAQPWSGVLDTSRAIDWSAAGAGAIPARATQCGSTISAYNGTATTINNAIAACTSGQHVKLGAGTFNLSTGIIFNNKSSVTLRGSGANSTFLVFSGNNACGGNTNGGLSGHICMLGSGRVSTDSANTANWTAGYTKGTTAITLSSTTNLSAGMLLLLDQANDDGSDTYPEVWTCHQGPTVCSVTTDVGAREQYQVVTVTSIDGSTVNITPGLHADNWRSGQSPAARWGSGQPSSADGLEDLSIDGTSDSVTYNNVTIFGASGSWVKNIRSVTPLHHHVFIAWTPNVTVRDSYMFGNQSVTDESYGVDLYFAGDALIENNIFQRMATPQICEYGWGSVFAYNYSIDNRFGADGNTWAQFAGDTHRVGCMYFLWEGNDGSGVAGEHYHGSSSLNVLFRNRYNGAQEGKDTMTVPVYLNAYARFWSVIGNVLGDSAWATTYQMRGGTDAQNSTNCNRSVFALGWGGNCDDGGAQHPPNDTRVVATTMRWGNWDTVNAAARFVEAEVPSGLSKYANAVPGSQSLPASFYLSGRPSAWWKANSITPKWPAIGPDVTSGALANTGNHADRIPARICFEDVLGGAFGDTTAKAFDATSCYAMADSAGGRSHGGRVSIGGRVQ